MGELRSRSGMSWHLMLEPDGHISLGCKIPETPAYSNYEQN